MSYNSLFPVQNSWLLLLSFLSAITSIALVFKKNYRLGLLMLIAAGFFVRLFVAYADPFLHPWDERYHALVARNMMDHPFAPMLRNNPLQHYDFRAWCCNHIWLHKQPLFLWQMALSMKMFGISEFSLRYPSVLLGTLMIPLVFRICDLAVHNKRTAFIASALMCFSYYHLELIAGYYGMDHNDISFDFYVLASIWAYAEYRQNLNLKWVLLIGLLAGCAVLNKWLTGLLVFGGWGVNILLSFRKENTMTEIVNMFIAIAVCLLVFMPWQLYIFHEFPAEAKYELSFNSKHLWEVVEGHSGTNWYYFDKFNDYFGEVTWLLIPIGIILMLWKKKRDGLTISIISMFLAVFLFFSFVAQTKVHAYFMIVVPLGYIFIAFCLQQLTDFKKVGNYIFIPITITSILLVFKLPLITNEHDPKFNNWETLTYNTNVFKQLKNKLPNDIQVLSNIHDDQEVEAMFYNKQLDAYSRADLNLLKDKKIKIAFFKLPGEKDVANEIKDYPYSYIIKDELR